jgi:hypothetical protein
MNSFALGDTAPWVGVSHHFREAEITYAPIIIVACKNILIQ